MEEYNQIKDYMLELASQKGVIDQSEIGLDKFIYWRRVFKLVEKDGYITESWNVHGAIAPTLTDDGYFFYKEGGYSQVNTEVTENKEAPDLTRKLKDFSLDILKEMIKNISVELLRKMIQ